MLFGSTAWQSLLEAGFNCRTLYGWDGNGGAAITVFRAGPFRIGYLGFPVGNLVGNDVSRRRLLFDLASSKLRRLPVCVRVQMSGFVAREHLDWPVVSTPETAIPCLQDWALDTVSKRLRRDVRKAERSGLVVSRLQDPDRAREIDSIYRKAVERQGGSARYTSAYFDALVELARDNRAVRIYLAVEDSEIAAFAAVLRHGNIAYYLHGGVAAGYRASSPSDLILARAIEESKSEGAEQFNFMASPVNQPSLVRYKEKWGGETRQCETYTAALSPAYRLFAAAERIHRFIS